MTDIAHLREHWGRDDRRAGGGTRPRGRAWSPRQRQLLDDLQVLFLAEGFRHLTIGDLADRLRCSRRTLYGLAPSKEELVLIVVDRLFNRMGIEARTNAAACDDPGEAIAAYLDAGMSTLTAAQSSFTEDLESYLPTRHLYDRHLAIALAVLGSLVEDGVRAGVFREFHPPLIAEILDACVARIRDPAALNRAGVSNAQAIAEFSRLIRHGLLVDADTGVRPATPQPPARRSARPRPPAGS
jgi:AcrR family transcriptional regulator